VIIEGGRFFKLILIGDKGTIEKTAYPFQSSKSIIYIYTDKSFDRTANDPTR
jgi:hypothetical protein